MEKRPKTVSQHVIDALMSGKSMRLGEITEMVSQAEGKTRKVTDLSSILSLLSNPDKCDLGNFIIKTKKDSVFIYSVVEEFLKVPIEKVYGLSMKTKGKYTFEEAVREYPELQKYKKRESGQKKIKAKTGETDKPEKKSPKDDKEKAPALVLNGSNEAALVLNGSNEAALLKSIMTLIGKENLSINVHVRFSFDV